MNLISYHGFTKKKNPTVILLFCTWLVEYYLEKGFVIIEHNSKKLRSEPNEEKQRIHAINMHQSYFVMDCYVETSSLANTINKLHIQSDLHSGYIHNLYHDKQEITYELFCQYIY